MFTTPQDFYNAATKYIAALPKTPTDLQEMVEKTKKVVQVEADNAKEVITTYNKAANGNASMSEISKANKKAQELMVAARFATVVALPGGVFALPFLIEASKEYGFDFVPASVSKEFGI